MTTMAASNLGNPRLRVTYPFTAIVGMEKAKLALLTVSVNPLIGGVLLRGDKGTGKTTLVRGLANVLPEIEVVADCPFNCNPRNPMEMCDNCYLRWSRGEKLRIEKRKMKVVDLPLSVTPDRLIGTVDFEKALREGVRTLKPGLLAEANRNILYIDEVNLLDDYIADLILDAAAFGWNIIEREHISFKHPAKFILVGSMNPEEGELRPQLLDRFGLVVDVEAPQDPEVRAEIVRRVEDFSNDPISFYKKYLPKEEELKQKIVNARKILPRVEVDDELLRLLAKTLVELKIRTCRAEIVTVRVAKALAALDGRTKVTLEDLKKAMELALPHRISLKPFEPQEQKSALSKVLQRFTNEVHNEHEGRNFPENTADKDSHEPHNGKGNHIPRNEMKSERSKGGNSDKVVPPEKTDLRIPEIRRQSKDTSLNSYSNSRYRYSTVINEPFGVQVSYMSSVPNHIDVDVVGTIVNMSSLGIRQILEVPKDLAKDLIAVKVRRRRIPSLTIIAVDSSGSMNVGKRIALAKGIAQKIIEVSYTKRSWLSLIAFRRDGVSVYVPPTKKYGEILNKIVSMPTGGRTPLPAALEKIIETSLVFKAKHKNPYVRAILITDGKANKPLYTTVEADIAQLSEKIGKAGIELEIYDTRGNSIDPAISYIDKVADYAGAKIYRV